MVRNRVKTAIISLLSIGAVACGGTGEPGVARGEAVFDTCAPCHGAEGFGDETLGAPAIAGLPQWYIEAQLEKFFNGWRGAHPMDTVGIRMRSMALALDVEGDLESVAEYVAAMPAPAQTVALAAGDARAGQTSYQLCAACHGAEGDGNELLGAPPLTGQHDWYLLRQLQKFKLGWRGTNPNDVSGATMRPNSIILDDAAMENVVAYIRSLQ